MNIPSAPPPVTALSIAARCFGMLEAQGLLRAGEAAAVLAHAAGHDATLRAASLRQLAESRAASAAARRAAAHRIRAAIAPLLTAWAAPGAILRACLREAGTALTQREAAHIAAAEMRRLLARTK